MTFGLSERGHGADIYATDMILTPGRCRRVPRGRQQVLHRQRQRRRAGVGLRSPRRRRRADGYVFFAEDSRHPAYHLVRNFDKATKDCPSSRAPCTSTLALILKFMPNYHLRPADVAPVPPRHDPANDQFLFHQSPARGLGAIRSTTGASPTPPTPPPQRRTVPRAGRRTVRAAMRPPPDERTDSRGTPVKPSGRLRTRHAWCRASRGPSAGQTSLHRLAGILFAAT
jgi:hypothetical protein